MHKIWLLLLLISFGTRLQAEPDIDDMASMEWAFSDSPLGMEKFAREQYRRWDPATEPRRWVRAVWIYAMLVGSWTNSKWLEKEDIGQVILKAREIATTNGYHEELIQLQFVAGEMYLEKGGIEPKFYENTLAMVERYKLSNHWRIKVLVNHSYALRDAGHIDEAMSKMQDAYQLLKSDPDASPLDQITVRTIIALMLRLQKNNGKAQELWEENEKILEKYQLRSFHATNLYNFGFYELKQNDPKLWPSAEQHFRRALQLATEIGEEYNAGSCLLGLASLLTEKKEYAEAIQLAAKAAALYKRIDGAVWEGEAHKRGATPLIRSGRFQEALAELDLAANIFSDEYELDQQQIADGRYAAYKGLGQFAKALEQLEKSTALQKKMADEKEDKGVQDKMVQLGMQVEEEKNKVLQKDNELQSQRLREADRLRWILVGGLILALVVIGLMVFAIWEAAQVKETRLRMQRILDTIEEGILTIDPHLAIEAGYSRYLATLLPSGESLKGLDLIESLFASSSLTADEKHLMRQVLFACFGEGQDVWDFNAHQLPVEFAVARGDQSLTLALHWQPIFNHGGHLHQVLLGIRDISDRRQMQIAMQAERVRNERQAQKMSELAARDPRLVKDLLQRLVGLDMLGTDRQFLLRALHTAKGIARSLKLRTLSAAIHNCEDALIQNQPIDAAVTLLQTECQDYQHIMHNIFKLDGPLPAGFSPTLASRVTAFVPELTDRLQQAGLQWGGLLIDDQLLPWPEDLLVEVTDLLVHAMTNSIDHGFILPQRQGFQAEPVRLLLRAIPEKGCLRLSLEDNGFGIDWEKLRTLAREKGFPHKTEQDLQAFLFEDGISTAQSTTESSGRGVGLAAVRSISLARQGTVELKSRLQGRGTQLVVILPITLSQKHSHNISA